MNIGIQLSHRGLQAACGENLFTMRKLIQFALVLLFAVPAMAATWYVDAVNGGTRYSTYNHSGQCNGKSPHAYPGSGANQPCPFNDYRYLYDAGATNPAGANKWVISGGDTVIITQNYPAGQTGWRVGMDPSNLTLKWCDGVNGWNLRCYNPTIPAGTAEHPTQILGSNYANCTTPSAKTQLFGSSGAYFTFNIAGAHYVNIECLEFTTHNSARCIPSGTPITSPTTGCNYNDWPKVPPYTDWAWQGIWTDNTETNVLLQDVSVHGFLQNGVQGPFDTITLNRVRLYDNLVAGWNFDDACGCSTQNGGHMNAPGGSFTAHYLTIEWNGCLEEYPIVDPIPVARCHDQESGVLADGLSGQDSVYGSFYIDHLISRYNTKNGIDLGHLSGNVEQITDSQVYGNMGGQFKLGKPEKLIFSNNFALGNCHRMSALFPGAPPAYNKYLSLWCRAETANGLNYLTNAFDNGGTIKSNGTTVTGSNTHFTSALIGTYIAPSTHPVSTYARKVTAVSSPTLLTVATPFPTNLASGSDLMEQLVGNTAASSTVVDMYHNTFVGYEPSVWDDWCFDEHTQPVDPSFCAGGTFVFEYNVTMGYSNTTYNGGQTPSMFPSLAPTTDVYNLYFNVRYTGRGSNNKVSNPLFVDEPATPISKESALDNFNFNLRAGSPATGLGAVSMQK